MGEPNPWVLATIANEGFQQGFADDLAPHHPDTLPEKSAMELVITVLKVFLPILTLGLGFVLDYLLNYVLNDVVFVLATVETPIPGRVDSEKIGSEKYGILSEAEEKAFYQSKSHYTTSSIRSTMRHLNAEAGDLSMFRGMGADLAIACLITPVGMAINFLLGRITTNHHLSDFLLDLVMSIIFAQADTVCTHIVISKPRHKFWFRRLGVSWFGAIRTLSLALAAQTVARNGTDWIFSLITEWTSSSSTPKINSSGSENVVQFLGDAPVVPLSLTLISMILVKWFVRAQIKPLIKLLFTVPVDTIKLRVQGSMLPDTDDPIIPMDRSFQGRPQSGGILQQQGQPLSFMQAARTINKRTFLRILKLDIKQHLIREVALYLFMAVLFAEVVWLVGPSAVWVVLKMVMGTPIVQADLDAVVGNTTRSILDKVVEGMVQVSQNQTLNTTNIDWKIEDAKADVRRVIDSFNTTTTMVA